MPILEYQKVYVAVVNGEVHLFWNRPARDNYVEKVGAKDPILYEGYPKGV